MTNRLLTWPSAAKVIWSEIPNVSAHNRGAANTGGHYAYEIGPGAVFEATISVQPMLAEVACDFRGFLHSLRGRGGTFLLQAGPVRFTPDPCGNSFGGKTHFTDCTKFTDGTTFADDYDPAGPLPATLSSAISAGASSLSIIGHTGSSLFVAGALAVIGDITNGGQLVRITSVSGATANVIPRVRSAYAVGAPLKIGNVTGLFRLDQEPPAVPLDGFKSAALTLKISEVY